MARLETDRPAALEHEGAAARRRRAAVPGPRPRGVGARHHRRRRPERRRHPLPLRLARRAGGRGDRAPRRGPRRPSPCRARGPAAPPRRRRPSATSSRGLVFAYVGMVEAEGPDAQRWVDLMHSLWLDRSPALAFMAEYADQERDWEHLARQALPGLPADVFEARFGLAIETIIVGLRTPSPAPGSAAAKLPARARAPGPQCSSTSSPPHWKGNADVTGAHRGARAGDPPRHHEPPRAAQRPEPGVDRRAPRDVRAHQQRPRRCGW